MAEANWYVVHTYSGYENKVKVDIEKTIENRNLQDQILCRWSSFLPITMRWISEVPSPIRSSGASR